ncbi:hypothetical protein EK21DRAFT_103512 [Setomelanomma holmii]|uniref:Uncharacterized protein n=1 Tax=Setomelanomma holmii TaxID=210430 RepID=A0A9P4H2U4_9PLEO|nr:hypothetical protein EK21DRAFT_103512 [Setomelanomma holmii]
MTSTTNYDVQLGFWTNWSHGQIQGATVTLTRRNGGFLIAFLAIFIGMVGKSFWRLGCFVLHRYFSTSEAQDGLYHQRQAILRNSDTAQDGAWRMLMSMLAWRSGNRARRPILRLLPIIILAFAISSVFGIASIFSSNVTSETLNQVLLKGTRCGSFSPAKANSVYKQLTLLLPYQAEKANKFLNYGMQCYTNNSHTDGCNTYLKPRLPLISTRGNPCPFGDNICKLDNDNLIMDTGYLDSLDDLGINTAQKDRFQLRMVYQCAPLKTQGYMKDYNDSDYGAVKRYMYGPVVNVKQTINWTYEVPVDNAYLPGDGTSSANIPRLEYQLGIEKHYGTPNETLLPGTNDWSPIPALRLVDADVHLAFLSAPEIHFSTPVNDPWFSAHKNASEINNQDTRQKFEAYLQDEPLGVMACTQQVQYCNPNLPKGSRCEPLRGVIDPRKSARVKQIFPSDSQFATIKWVDDLWTYGVYTISATLGFIGASALRARYSLSYGYSGPIPDNQWQLEAEHWIKGTLASLQDVFIEAANGMPAALEDFRQPPAANDTVARNMCVNQKIVSNAYSSFNVLGLSLILGIGVVIIVLDTGLEPSVAWWQRRKFRKRQQLEPELGTDEKETHPLYAAIEWSQTSILQLQRMAHDEAGYGEWSKCDKDVPVTEPGQLITSLNLSNVEYPMLRQKEETPVSDRDETDTGLETLVEDQAENEKKSKEDVDEMPPMFHAISERLDERGHGLGVHMHDEPGPEANAEDWRTLR